MEVLNRADVDLAGGNRFSYKEMANGEIRNRLVFATGNRVSETVAEEWGLEGEMYPWQDAHFHRGQTEYYLLTQGWVIFLFEEKGALYHIRPSVGHMISFPPRTAHTVLLGTGAVMVTLLTGQSVGNPDRKNEDWWPAVDYAAYSWELKKAEIEETLRL